MANFGAFVDIGVHQDGLVHISELADRFVSDPREVVKAGDIVQVKVMEVDIPRKRIALSMRSEDKPSGQIHIQKKTSKPGSAQSRGKKEQIAPAREGTLAQAFASAKRKK